MRKGRIILLILSAIISLSAFSQTKVIAPITANSPLDTYPTHYDSLGYSGYRVVTDTATRNNIKSARRKNGMLVFSQADSTMWQLDSTKNPIWLKLWTGTALGKVNLDSVVTRVENYPDSTGYWGYNYKGDTILMVNFTGVGGEGAFDFDSAFATKTTSDLAEGSNLYFTNTRARGALSATAPLTYNSSTGVFGIPAATSSQNGYLTSSNWSTFNNKLSNITGLITAGSGVTITGSGTSGSPYSIAASGGGGGTVTSFSKTDGWGIISSVTNPTTTPNLTHAVDSVDLSTYYLRRKDSVQYVTPKRLMDTAADIRSMIAGARYFPTLSAGTNVSSVSMAMSSYMKAVNVVHVAISGNVTPNSANTLSDITFTLPFPTTLTTQGRLGVGTFGVNGSLSGFNSGIITLVDATTAKFSFFSGTPVASGDISLEFQYLLQ